MKLGDLLDQAGFVYQIRKLCHNDAVLAVVHRLNVGNCTNTDLAASGAVCLADTGSTHNNTSGRKIRSLDDSHQLINSRFLALYIVIDQPYNCFNHFCQIVRRDIGRHTNCDTSRTVYQKIRKTGWKNARFTLSLIVVWHEINGVFVQIIDHVRSDLGKSCLCVSHCGSSVSIHRSEVTMSIHKCISHGPILCHVDKCSVNRAVTMRMVFTHCITYDTRTFLVWLVVSVVHLVHGEKDSSLNRL